MFDQNMIDSAWGNAGMQTQPQGGSWGAPPMKPAAAKKKKSFLVDNISTGLGIAGGIGGGILGAAAGGVGAIPGAALGSGAGSALGETLENAITGDKLTNNVAKEGVLGTVFGAGPIRGAKFVAGAAKGIAQGGGKQAIRQASDEAAKFTLRGAVGKKVTDTAPKLATRQFGLTDKYITDYTKKYGEDAGKTLIKYGINSADEAEKLVTKQQGAFDNLVAGVGDIDKSKIQTKLTSIADGLLKEGPSQQKAAGEKLLAETNQLLANYGDKLPASAVNKLRQQYDSLVNYNNKVADPRTYEINKRVADGLRETIQDASGSTELRNTGKELSKLYSLNDEIAERAAKVESRGSSPLGFRNLVGGGIGALMGSAAGGGLPGAMLGAGGVAFANSSTGRRIATNAAVKGGEKLLAAGEKAGIKQQGIGNTAARIGAGGLLTNGSLQGQEQPVTLDAVLASSVTPDQSSGNLYDTYVPSATPNSMNNTANMDSSYQNTPVSSSPYSREDLLADMQRDPERAQEYIQYYKQLDEIFNPAGQMGNVNATTRTALAGSQNGIDTLSQLEGLYQQAGGGAGRVGGAIQSKLGDLGFNNNAATYNALSASTVSQLAKALNGGGQVSDTDAAVITQALPRITDTPQVAQAKFQALKARLAAAQQNAYLYGAGDNSSLENSLTGGYN